MSVALGQDPFVPRQPREMRIGLALALLAHVLLIAALAFGVNWRSREPEAISAELWSAVPQAEAPREAAVAPAPPEPPRPEPRARPAPERPSAPDPQIALEQVRREKLKRDQAERVQAEREKAEREKAEREKAEREKLTRVAALQAEKKRAEKERAEADKLAATREANLQRMLGQVGATGGPGATGNAARSAAPSANYAGRVMARIKPNIVYTDALEGNPMATVEVRVAPDGTIIGKRLIKSSGVKSWDEAVLRAVERTEILPRDIDGRVPPSFEIDFKRRD